MESEAVRMISIWELWQDYSVLTAVDPCAGGLCEGASNHHGGGLPRSEV